MVVSLGKDGRPGKGWLGRNGCEVIGSNVVTGFTNTIRTDLLVHKCFPPLIQVRIGLYDKEANPKPQDIKLHGSYLELRCNKRRQSASLRAEYIAVMINPTSEDF